MKIMLLTVPIRADTTTYPPLGALSIMNYARKHGFDDVELYDIDCLRPSYSEVLKHIEERKPDVIGISAVVSTAYKYVKDVSLDAKKILPDCKIVVGGNLAASAEIVLKMTGVDVCVIGEGERTFVSLLRKWEQASDNLDLADIPGLAYLLEDRSLKCTDYADPIPNEEMFDIDWNDLERFSDIRTFIFPAYDTENGVVWASGRYDPRSYENSRRNKTVATIAVGKGCVARCTFCHRWDKGLRHIPVDVVIERMKYVMQKYDVGCFDMAIESFGSDKRWLGEFCEKVKDLGILWRAAGVRVKSVSPEWIEMMKELGCVSLIYGFESGSPDMLAVMEKKTDINDNYSAAKWTLEHGLLTIAQLVLGMPGENEKTISDSIKFSQFRLQPSSLAFAG